MADSSSIDNERAHKFFSAHCFNSAWELIDKPERTPEENEQMIQRTMASLWHWTQRVVEIGCRRYTRLLHSPSGNRGVFSFTGGWEEVGRGLASQGQFP